jgi:hypothetical protein
MLSSFQVTKTFHGTKMKLWVDNERSDVSLLVTYKGRITENRNGREVCHWVDVRTPELAEAWLSQTLGKGTNAEESMIEYLHRRHVRQESEG